jgi:SRSO17 transposase
MEVKDIKHIGRKLKQFLSHFDSCFARSEPRGNLETIVRGQLSALERKSLEPIALAAGVVPRTLQEFVSNGLWDHLRLRDLAQDRVAQRHAHPRATGIIDESGNPKKGSDTCGVQRQWCGNTGKIDNCVVAVHLGYVVGDFQCLLDSDLFLPQEWADDPVRRRKTKVPEEVVFRTKPEIALAQVERALNRGIRFESFTFDELYGRSGPFLDGLLKLGQEFVGEIPSDFVGWVRKPGILERPPAKKPASRGRKRHFPRLSHQASAAREVRDLVQNAQVFARQPWDCYRIKDGEKGPIVWEVKSAPFYRKEGENGLPQRAHTLIVARNALNTNEVKYFLASRSLATAGVTREDMLWTAFSRWSIERCFEIGKRDLGMDHFEMRQWPGLHRHFYISQLTQLFCAEVQQELREKNGGGSLPDRRTGAAGGRCLDHGPASQAQSEGHPVPADGRCHPVSSRSQSCGTGIPLEENHQETGIPGNRL